MIQPALPAPLSALGLPGEGAAMPVAAGTEALDFGALLAIQGLPTALPEDAAPAGPALPSAMTETAIPAPTGKILPPALPGADELTDQPEVTMAMSLPASAKPVHPVAKEQSEPGKVIKKADQSKSAIEGDAPISEPAQAAADPAMPGTPMAIVVAVPAPSVPSASSTHARLEPEPGDVRPEPATQLTIAPRLLAPTPDRFSAPPAPPIVAPVARPVAASEALRDSSAPIQPAPPQPAPTEQVRVALALPRLAQAATAKAPADDPRPTAKPIETPSGEALPLFTPAQPHFPSQDLATATPTVAPQVRPHDFAALIDRLSAAREAAAPQAVSITVSHQDFGPVRLHFRPDETGLSVAMASADPDFARVAANAPAPVVPVAASAETAFSQGRSDGAAGQTSAQGGGAQSRGSFAGQRESHGQPQANPSPRSRGNARPDPRPGIFA